MQTSTVGQEFSVTGTTSHHCEDLGIGKTDIVEATFAFVDLAGFTALTETHGDAEAVSTARSFQDRVRNALQPDDELVKTIGDAVMLKFPSPERAVMALQDLIMRELSTVDATLAPRVGAHHGTAVSVDGDYYGASVNLAARVAGEANGGQLLVTEGTADAARLLGATITHVGFTPLRNVATPVDIFEVRASDAQEPVTIDPVCHMRVPAEDDTSPTLKWQGREIRFCGLPCLARFATRPDRYHRL